MLMTHVTIRTNKFDDEINFFLEYTGLSIVRDLRQFGKNIVFLSDGTSSTELEIIELPNADVCGNEFISIGFKTDDAVKKCEEMKSAGFSASPMFEPRPNMKFFYVSAPSGAKIQFMQ